MPNRRQAINLTDGDQIIWRHKAIQCHGFLYYIDSELNETVANVKPELKRKSPAEPKPYGISQLPQVKIH